MFRAKNLVLGARLALIALCALASPSHAERYYVTQDGFGNVDAEKQSAQTEQEGGPSKRAPLLVPEAVAPAVVESDTVEPDTAKPSIAKPSITETSTTEPSIDEPGTVETASSKAAEASAKPVEVSSDVLEVLPVLKFEASLNSDTDTRVTRQKKILSSFERAFLESEGQNPYDATAIDEALYVDSQDLLEGKVSQQAQQPFFITRDRYGNESVTFYSPSLAQEAKDNADQLIRYTQATVYSRSEQNRVSTRLPADADPVAVQILLQGEAPGESYFESFVKRCCERLPKAGVKVLEFGRSELLNIDRDLLPYRFTEGDSRYVIIRLPESSSNYPFEIRSFIHRYKQESVESGVFFPQLVTLNKALKPMRVIVDPVLEYVPETWSGYGYLKGFFEIDRTKDLEEEYILINTTREALKTTSEYSHPESPIIVQHMKFGSLGVKALPSEPAESP